MKLANKFNNYLKLIRFDKPIGTVLLLMPTLWGLWIASAGIPDIKILCVFIFGVFLMRSAGCIINDIFDRNFDGHVERTKNRPLVTNTPSAQVTVLEASILMLIFCLIAFFLVLLLNNTKLILHSVIGLLLACVYPLCKRFFPCPQFVLGLAFSYSLPMAFIAVIGKTNLVTWLLYLSSLLLTIIYDSFYAMVDVMGDKNLGLKSSVIWFGKFDLIIIVMLQVLFLILLLIIGYLLQFTVYYCFLFMVLLLFMYQFNLAKSRVPFNCFLAFKNNAWVGFLIFLGLFLEYY